ncbi:histidinol-phosphate transaminase [Anabaenopsis sp. FSS-46]|uniref:histidinol-phosphate transaminase n=1 Tax=Anabaenopsis sp. FSS-46 TaxID=2971766 RepID=UPI0024739DD9|nr:histidinol-phosphate transaminase [Anabaenopsis sp. FSS-46]MDH6100828.1 histidinol-phosphate transaminase [Anabaenopsis sp. FSS-46]
MNNYFRNHIRTMASYVPSEQPQPGLEIIKLNSNENPYPPSPVVLDLLKNINGEWLRRYPEPLGGEFRRAASKVLGVPHDWIIVGNGSDEVLNLVVRACAEPGRKVVYPIPTYVLYVTLVQIQGAEIIQIPYGEDDRFPLEELITADGNVTFIASPNSPSGCIVPMEDLRKLASRLSGVLVIDEAYVDFAQENALALVKEYDNVVVVRTLSKGYSLAGLRLGFGVANPRLLDGLFKVKDSYNIDAIACALGAAAITDQAYKNACVAKVKGSRTKLATDLKQLGFQVGDSQTNFLLVQPLQENAQFLYQRLKERQILVRYFPHPGLDHKLRITVGTDQQNQVLVEALRQICS